MRPRLAAPSLPLLAVLVGLAALPGCVSYGVGTTAATLPKGERTFSTLLEGTPGADDDATCEPLNEACLSRGTGVRLMSSSEMRVGLSERSDMGIRVIGGTGLAASYKRRLSRDSTGLQQAVVVGGGVLNRFNTASVEGAFLLSAPEGAVTPFGGVRVQQTVDLSGKHLQDRPTVGVFAGARLGSVAFGISPEIGVHYDPSVTGQRSRNVIVVPVITIHGIGVLDALLGGSSFGGF